MRMQVMTGQMRLVSMPHDLLGLAGDKLVGHFRDVLRVAGLFDTETDPHEDKEEDHDRRRRSALR